VASASSPPGIVDTDILIDDSHGNPAAITLTTAQRAAGGLTVSIVSAMELVVGCRNGAELSQLQQFLAQVRIWPISARASQNALQLMEQFSLSHGLEIADALIAAAALEQGLPLYTKNLRHFQMIPGLMTIRPY
jgi:predicted nucleic acid-binding protein